MKTTKNRWARALTDSVDELAMERTWRAIVETRHPPNRRQAPQRPRALWALALLGAAAACLLLVRGARSPEPTSSAGALARSDGRAIGAMVADRAQDIPLNDGSRISLETGGVLMPLVNRGDAFSMLLRKGVATFDVYPGGSRRWSIEAGLCTVEVIGTHFRVERDNDHVRVHVDRGIVLVRGDDVPDHVQRLVDGEEVDVRKAAPAALPTAPVAETSALAPPTPPIPGGPASSPVRRATWRPLADQGAFGDAYAELGSAGVARETNRAEDSTTLFSLADVARLSGHPEDAVAPLERIVVHHHEEPSAALAAFMIGKIQIDSLGRPSQAADAFAQCIALGAPHGLEEDAYARLVEARARRGDLEGTRAAAHAYRERFPTGGHVDDVNRWSAE